jgi:hypothetical protein
MRRTTPSFLAVAAAVAVAVAAAVALASADARALAEPSATTTESVVRVPPQPAVGALSAEDLDKYFNELSDRVTLLQLRVDAEWDTGTADARDQHKVDVARHSVESERQRLMKRNSGLTALGIALTALGGTSAFAAVNLAIFYSFSPWLSGEHEGGLAAGAIVTGVAGAALLGAGIPILVVGHHWNPREPRETESVAPVRIFASTTDVYVGMRLPF